MAKLKLYVLGTPRLVQNDQNLAISRRKSLALLVYLTITTLPQTRETLATLLWPDVSQRQARGSLRRALADLSKVLGPERLLTEGDQVDLAQDGSLWSDAVHFQTCLDQANCADHAPEQVCHVCAPHLQEAVALYQADFLAGFTLRDAPNFDDWQFFQAESLRQSLTTALERLAWGYATWEDYDTALPYAQRWVSLDPLHEPAQQVLMKIYYYNDQATAALRQYELFSQHLEDEFGVPPSDETATLYEAIKANRLLEPSRYIQRHVAKTPDPPPTNPPAKTATHHLPAQPTPFVERTKDLGTIGQFLTDADRRLVTLVGPGGMGKTRLALAAAEANKGAFPNGVHFVPLAPLNSADHIASAIIETLEIKSFNPDQPKTQLLDYLATRQLLLIMDNFEHILDGVELVVEVLEAAPQVKVLATSRERLNLRSETIFGVEGMSYPDLQASSNGDPPESYSAIRLLQQQAHLIQPDFTLDQAEMAEAIQLCHLVRGIPLAIVLATSWLELLSLAEIRAEITRSLDFLETEMRDVPDRQRSMRAVFNTSWQRLPDEAQQIFMKLSVFKGGFTRDAAESVAGAGLRTLRLLLNKSFITHNQANRYEIHELLGQYGYEKLTVAGQEQELRQKHSAYFMHFMAERELDLRGRAQAAGAQAIKADLENIRSAWRWALAHKNEAGIIEAAEGLHIYFATLGNLRAGIELFNQAHQALAPTGDQVPSQAFTKILIRLCFMRAFTHLEVDHLKSDIETCLTVAQTHHNEFEIALCTVVLGYYFYAFDNDLGRAVELAEKALDKLQPLDDRFYMIRTLSLLAQYHSTYSNIKQREAHLRQGLVLSRQINSTLDTAMLLYNLTEVLFALGQYDEIKPSCQEIFSLTDAVDQAIMADFTDILLSLDYILRGDLSAAYPGLEKGWQLYADNHVSYLLAFVSACLSVWSALNGDSQTGRDYGQQSLATEVKDSFFIILGNWGAALSCCNQQDYPAAREYLKAGLQQAADSASIAMQTWLLPIAAVTLANEGQTEQSLELLALASHHPLSPTGWHACWEPLGQLQTACEAEFDAETYQAIWTRGQNLDLETVVAEWLDGTT